MIHSIQYTLIVYKYVALYPLEHLDNRKIMKGGVTVEIKPINEFKNKNNFSDGLSFMDAYHSETNPDIISKLTGETYLQVRANNGAGEGTPVDNEHLINVRDPEKLYSHQEIQNKYTHQTSYVTRYIEASTIGQYSSDNYKNRDAIKVTKDEYANFLKGSTMPSDPEDMYRNRFSRFSRYGYIDTANEFITGTREYVFFSKPDLHLIGDGNSIYTPLMTNSFLMEAFNHYRYSFYSLQQTFSGGGNSLPGQIGVMSANSSSKFDPYCKYIPLLSNMITSTLDLGDITASDVENNRNLYQINTTYREGSLSSDLQYDFSLEFKDTKYLDVYMLFKIYDEYCRHKYYADIEPTKEDYIINRIYPEAISIWKVIVDDTDRIVYWAKAIGCTPMSVPRGSLSNFENQIKFTINWKAQFVKDMDPINLMELNHLSELSMHDSKPSSFALPSAGETWVGYPYVIKDGGPSGNFRTHARTGDNGNGRTAPDSFYKLVWAT